MKTIFKILAILFMVSCKAQAIQPLYPYGTDTPSNDNAENLYYKDVDNDFNPYVGTWKWENSNNSLTIIFNKVVHNNDRNGDYSDLLVGEYQYIENGVELVNTFPLLDPIRTPPNIVNQEDPWDNNIKSVIIAKVYKGIPPCPECDPNARSIVMEFSEPSKPNLGGKLIMTQFEENGIEKIRARIFNTFNLSNIDGMLSIPENSIWTLIKQN
jgi:hypothetical protein